MALTLNAVLGLGADAIAAAFLVETATMTRRITRAKEKIRDASIQFEVPGRDQVDERLLDVLKVVELVFNEGYRAARGIWLDAPDLAQEALGLARALARLSPDAPEMLGLLATLAFTQARRAARVGPDGALVRLMDQDRSLWDAALIADGRRALGRAARLGGEGRYVLRAVLAGAHSCAARHADTDWECIVEAYDRLLALEPSGVIELNRAIALGEARGPLAMLAALARLAEGEMERSHYLHAARADAFERLGRLPEARAAWAAALARVQNGAERAELERRLGALG